MKLTIAICTWNRDALLNQALSSIGEATPPRADWEIIVVNNNCTDGTDAVVNRFRERLPIVLVHEPRPGLSNARNAAIDAASGDYMIWTDDDVRVRADWIVEYERAFTEWPEASVFGGPISPAFEGKPPKWLQAALPHVDGAFAVREPGSGVVRLTASSGKLPYGANFAVRIGEQRRFRYDAKLGKRPGKLMITDEETAVILAILADGGSGVWLPSAAVDHCIPRSKQTVSYVRSWYKGQGWMHGADLKVTLSRGLPGSTPMLWCLALIKELRYRTYRIAAGPRKWAPALKSAALAWGKVASRKSV